MAQYVLARSLSVNYSDGHNLISAMHVQYGTSCRDHIPLIVDISIESVPVLEDTF